MAITTVNSGDNDEVIELKIRLKLAYLEIMEGLMSELSEAWWCCGWYKGVEFQLWHRIIEKEKEDKDKENIYTTNYKSSKKLQRLKVLSEDIDAWYHVSNDNGSIYMDIASWEKCYEAWKVECGITSS